MAARAIEVAPTVLVVSDPDARAEIVLLLDAAGLAVVHHGAGAADALELCAALEPDAVVLCASLAQGDARSLAAAIAGRSGEERCKLILVGDAGGPIRTAEDAAGFAVDRFVARPLEAASLGAAVRACIGAGPPPPADEPAAVDRGAPAASLDRAMEAALSSFVDAAMSALGDDLASVAASGTAGGADLGFATAPTALRPLDEAPSPVREAPLIRSGPGAPRVAAADPAEAPLIRSGPGAPRVAAADPAEAPLIRSGPGAPRVAAADPAEAPLIRSGPGAPRVAAADPAEAPLIRSGPGAPRVAAADPAEAPLIRSGPGAPRVAAADPAEAPLIRSGPGAPRVAAADPAEAPLIRSGPGAPRVAAADPAEASGAAGSPQEAAVDPSPPDDPEALDDERLTAELEALERPRRRRGVASSGGDVGHDPDAPGRSGERMGGFGGELRRKMSAMAERLFPTLAGDRQRVHASVAHDSSTDIDLTAIGVEAQGGAPRFAELGSGDTFAELHLHPDLATTLAGEAETAGADPGDAGGRRRGGGAEPPARGDLAEVDVASLLAGHWVRGFTGRVVLRQDSVEKMIQLEDGRPVFVSSNVAHDRMGDLLYREGKIAAEQHRQASALIIESGRRMGEILVELGFIKPRELLPTVRRHLEDVIYSTFGWERGEFVCSAAEPTGERVRLTRHPAALILEGVRRKYDGGRLAGRLGTGAAIVAARPSRTLAGVVAASDLSAAERALVARLDGERTIEAAARVAELDVVAALQISFVLVALGVAELLDRGLGGAPGPSIARSPSLVGETDLAIDRQRVLTKHALVEEADYFLLLGVRRDASSFEIRRAYEAARRDFAVESFPAELQRELAAQLGEIAQLIDEAYRVLRSDRVRLSYRDHLVD